MILNESFIEQVSQADKLDNETYSKIINYTISFIAKSDTKIKLSEILECSEQEAEPLLNLFIVFITYFSKLRAGGREFKANLEMIKISDQKKEIFINVFFLFYL